MADSGADSCQVVDEIRSLFRRRGASMYGGEAVTQLEHALQAAMLAERDRASAATISAALLHDVGHLMHDLPKDAPESGVDDAHERLASDWLEGRFPREVVDPVRFHVDAKRYLCAVDPSYREQLSEPSRVSLELQGGPMSPEEVNAFVTKDLLDPILDVRRFDDRAKVAGLATPDLDHFLESVEQCALKSL